MTTPHAAPIGLAEVSPLLAMGLGAALLCAGRQLFWLFVAAVGFFTAQHFALGFLGEEHHDSVLLTSLVAGGLGAMLALFLQKVAVSLAGSLTGAYLLDQFFRSGLGSYPEHAWVFLAAAGVVGALLMVVLFRWALIFITSAAGAHLLLFTVPLTLPWQPMAYAALFVIGIAIQTRRRRPAAV